MKTYYFRLYQFGDEDGETIWERANSEEEARDEAYHDFHSIDRLDLLWVE